MPKHIFNDTPYGRAKARKHNWQNLSMWGFYLILGISAMLVWVLALVLFADTNEHWSVIKGVAIIVILSLAEAIAWWFWRFAKRKQKLAHDEVIDLSPW